MTNIKHTKRTLLSSVVALILCCSMLIGTTYAWFTDEVTSANNVITAGNLDILVTDKNDKDIQGQGTLFQDILWEPGVVAYENITIKNEGTLALQYNMMIYFDNENHVKGTDYKLSQILKVAIVEGGVVATDRDSLTTGITNWVTLKDLNKEGELYPKNNADQKAAQETVGIVIWWQPTDEDNNWNVHNGKVVSDFDVNDPDSKNELHIDLGVHVYAQQLSYEKDSFDAEYDNVPDVWDGTADTTWYNNTDTEFDIMTAEQVAGLSKLIDAGNTFEGKTLKLGEDLDLYVKDVNGEPVPFEPIGSYRFDTSFKGTFDGQGHTISNLYQNTWALDNGYYYNDCGLGLFGAVEEGTVKNLVLDGVQISGESGLCGSVAAVAHNATFENITVKNTHVADYQYYAGGVVGWGSGELKFIGCNVNTSTIIAGQWGDFDNSNGGILGGASSSAKILMKDCTVACRIDAYNDVTSTYQWYAYRRSGMLIGNSGVTETVDGRTVATAPQLTCENVTVIYGEWANYTYCEFAGTSWPYVRVQAGVSNSAYSNPRYGHPTDANGNQVVDDNHVHNDGEDHFIECTFDQLYGGGQGVYGNPTHDGVTVIYNNK